MDYLIHVYWPVMQAAMVISNWYVAKKKRIPHCDQVDERESETKTTTAAAVTFLWERGETNRKCNTIYLLHSEPKPTQKKQSMASF